VSECQATLLAIKLNMLNERFNATNLAVIPSTSGATKGFCFSKFSPQPVGCQYQRARLDFKKKMPPPEASGSGIFNRLGVKG
jgi:hypothetical protein